MIASYIIRLIAVLFLVFHEIIFVGVVISSAGQLAARRTEQGFLYPVMYLVFSFILAVWLLGLIQQVVKADWAAAVRPHIEKYWREYVATVVVFATLFVLFSTPISYYASLGYAAGNSFGSMARIEFARLFNAELPSVLAKISAWTFQWFYASFMVGFVVWVRDAATGRLARKIVQPTDGSK
ncbi:MAG: hypothetical protein V1738_00920 [Patescibacteria group bacterium]